MLLGCHSSPMLLPNVLNQLNVIIRHIVSKVQLPMYRLEANHAVFIRAVLDTLLSIFDRQHDSFPRDSEFDLNQMLYDLARCCETMGDDYDRDGGRKLPRLLDSVSILIKKVLGKVPQLPLSLPFVDLVVKWASCQAPSSPHLDALAALVRSGTQETQVKMCYHCEQYASWPSTAC